MFKSVSLHSSVNEVERKGGNNPLLGLGCLWHPRGRKQDSRASPGCASAASRDGPRGAALC